MLLHISAYLDTYVRPHVICSLTWSWMASAVLFIPACACHPDILTFNHLVCLQSFLCESLWGVASMGGGGPRGMLIMMYVKFCF